MTSLEIENVRTKLLIAQIFSILSLVGWTGLLIYYAYVFAMVSALSTLVPFGEAFSGYLASTAITYGILFFVLMCVSAVVVKRIHDMYNAADVGNIEKLKQLNSVAWSIIALIFSGVVPGVMLLLTQGPIESLGSQSFTESPKPNPVDSLMRLKSQLDSGMITESEFYANKKRLLHGESGYGNASKPSKELVNEYTRNLTLATSPKVQQETVTSAKPNDDAAMLSDLKRRFVKDGYRRGNEAVIDRAIGQERGEVRWEHYERLWKLKSLLDSDVITKEEFEAQKVILLQRREDNLERSNMVLSCTECGSSLPAGAKIQFCPSCGTPNKHAMSSDVPKAAVAAPHVDVSRFKVHTNGRKYALLAAYLAILGFSTFGIFVAISRLALGQTTQFIVYGLLSLTGMAFVLSTYYRACQLGRTQLSLADTTNSTSLIRVYDRCARCGRSLPVGYTISFCPSCGAPQAAVSTDSDETTNNSIHPALPHGRTLTPQVKSSHIKRHLAICFLGILVSLVLITAIANSVLVSQTLSQTQQSQQVRDQLIMEAYDWTTPASLTLNLRNTGSTTLNLVAANYYVNGAQQTFVAITQNGTCTDPSMVSPGAWCSVTLTLASFTPTPGVAYVIKIVLPDGGVMSYSAVSGSSA